MSASAKVKRQWRAFKHDEPGHRFEHQHERLKRKGRAWVVAGMALGAVVVAAGIILLFIPGPGLLVVLAGLALIAGASRSVARVLDRAEPPARRRWQRVKRWWARTSRVTKGLVITGGVVLAIGVVLVGIAVVAG